MTAGRILFLPWDEAHNASARCRIFDLAAWLGEAAIAGNRTGGARPLRAGAA